MNETIELLDVVALLNDLPSYNLRRGEVGTVVEYLASGQIFWCFGRLLDESATTLGSLPCPEV
jgi:hypothetical protein